MENSNSASYLDKLSMVIIARPATQTIAWQTSVDGQEGINTNSVVSKDIVTVEVGIGSVETCVSAIGADYQNVGLASIDALFCPYVITPNSTSSGTLPYWPPPSGSFSGIKSTSLNPFNPNRMFHDTFFNSSGIYNSGHNICLANTLQGVGKNASGDLNVYKDLAELGSGNYSAIRSVGFKSPMVLTGWAYDLYDTPVPNTGTRQFSKTAFSDIQNWKSGPVDFKWDEDRALWTCNNFQCGVAATNFSAASGITNPSSGYLYVYKPLLPSTGVLLDLKVAYVFDSGMGVITSGTIVYFMSVGNINHVIFAGCSTDQQARSLLIGRTS